MKLTFAYRGEVLTAQSGTTRWDWINQQLRQEGYKSLERLLNFPEPVTVGTYTILDVRRG